MDYAAFLELVQEGAGVDREAAERLTRATLETLAEHLARGEADDLAAELPPELAAWLHTTTAAEGFDLDEFLRRVSERAGTDLAVAERGARAVFTALAHAASPKELADIAAELGRSYGRLLARGPFGLAPTAGEFETKVAERTSLDVVAARRATEAVLETLAERIAGGEVQDLIERLPVELHPPLKMGNTLSNGEARSMSLDEFVGRVAEREGVSAGEAREHTRAVLRTLREVVGDDEFFDVTVQLPDEYDVVLTGR
ncbi:MAG: hypothetical protein QOF29_3798 [bacterium]